MKTLKDIAYNDCDGSEANIGELRQSAREWIESDDALLDFIVEAEDRTVDGVVSIQKFIKHFFNLED